MITSMPRRFAAAKALNEKLTATVRSAGTKAAAELKQIQASARSGFSCALGGLQCDLGCFK